MSGVTIEHGTQPAHPPIPADMVAGVTMSPSKQGIDDDAAPEASHLTTEG